MCLNSRYDRSIELIDKYIDKRPMTYSEPVFPVHVILKGPSIKSNVVLMQTVIIVRAREKRHCGVS